MTEVGKVRVDLHHAAPYKTLVLDNGAYTIKAGLVSTCSDGSSPEPAPRVIPNCIARDRHRVVYVGSEIEACKDYGEMVFRRPVERGYIVNWEAQREIWDRECLTGCDPAETRLVLAEQPNALPALQSNCDQMVFEDFGFASYYRGIGPVFNAYQDIQALFNDQLSPRTPHPPAEAILVIDAGYSHTTITPVLQGRPLHRAIRRLDIAGRLLTQSLARLVSLRHMDMRSESHIVNEMKESACFVSSDFSRDLDACWKGTRGERRAVQVLGSGGIAKDYLLPDYHTRMRGILRDHDASSAAATQRDLAAADAKDVLTLRNERFVVPEALFHPQDLGSPQPGLPDTIMHALQALPPGLWPCLLANVVTVGGTAQIPGFGRRLQTELMERVPDVCRVRVACPADAVTSTWRGMESFARQEQFVGPVAVTKQEYEEHGAGWVARMFATGLGVHENSDIS